MKQSFCPGRTAEDLSDLNRQLAMWLDTMANVRIHDATGERPVDRAGEEAVQASPTRPFETRIRFQRKVSRDGYISYRGVRYSVPWIYSGGEVQVEERIGGALVIWWHGQRIAEHAMAPDGTRRVANPAHAVGLSQAQKQNRASGLRQCPPVERINLAC